MNRDFHLFQSNIFLHILKASRIIFKFNIYNQPAFDTFQTNLKYKQYIIILFTVLKIGHLKHVHNFCFVNYIFITTNFL